MSQFDAFPDVQPYNGIDDLNQRFTIRRALAWCKAEVGLASYDLDAAACLEAHHATYWYDGAARGDGLAEPWFGHVFCNPPWSDIEPWLVKAWSSMAEVSPVPTSISMLLPGDRTHRAWWQKWVEPFRDGRDWGEGRPLIAANAPHDLRLEVHFPPERFPYGHPGNPEATGCVEPNFTSSLLVWRFK